MMNTSYVEALREIANLDITKFSKCKDGFDNYFLNSFLYDIDKELNGRISLANRIHPSVGQGSLASIWWCGIFNFEFYQRVLGITYKGSMSAGRGHYIVYLFSEDKKWMYLTIAQSSAGLSKKHENIQVLPKNIEIKRTLTEIQTEKKLIQSFPLKSDNTYLDNIKSRLSQNGSDLGKDYELGIIYAIEYDLSKNIPNECFFNDLIGILEDFEIVKNFYIQYPYNHLVNFNDEPVENMVTDEDERSTQAKRHKQGKRRNSSRYPYENVYSDSDASTEDINQNFQGLTDEQRAQKDNREVEYITDPISSKKVAKRDPDLAKDALKKAEYHCTIDSRHASFLTKANHNYAEAHHLIPISKQTLFTSLNIDRSSNIVCLCVNCHKQIHHARVSDQKRLLKILYEASKIKNEPTVKLIAPDFETFIKVFYNIK